MSEEFANHQPLVQPVSDLEFAEGARDVERLIPPDHAIDAIGAGDLTQWHDLATLILNQGITLDHHFVPRDGIDAVGAMRHIGAILASSLDDDRMTRSVAYLCMRWFRSVRIGQREFGSLEGGQC